MENEEKEWEDDLFGAVETDPNGPQHDEQLGFDETAINPDDAYLQEEDTANSDNDTEKPDFLSSYLASKGVDKNKIRIENEYGDVEETPFDELSDSEKLAVLENINNLPISDTEIEDLNYLRSNKMNLMQFAEWQKQQAIEDYLAQYGQETHTVDQLDDDSLYIFELQERYPDLTDEEAQAELETAKQNPDLFAKKVSALRAEAKRDEDFLRAKEQEDVKQAHEQEFQQLAGNLINVASSIDELHGIELGRDDKEEIMRTLLDRDANGQSEFYKMFQDPEMVFKMAWYAKFGDQAFDEINKYYKKVIEGSRRNTNKVLTVNKRSTRKKDPDPYDLDDIFN